MNSKSIRWKQRFQNLEKAFKQLEAANNQKDLNDLEKSGLIQTFNFTFELCWKTLKDYLESKGIEEKFPRDILKTSFQNEIIENGHSWIEMLDKRNELIHIYSEDAVKQAVLLIKANYYPAIAKLINKLKNENI